MDPLGFVQFVGLTIVPKLMAGLGFVIKFIEATFVHVVVELAPVTVIVALAVGFSVTLAPVELLRPVVGVHE